MSEIPDPTSGPADDPQATPNQNPDAPDSPEPDDPDPQPLRPLPDPDAPTEVPRRGFDDPGSERLDPSEETRTSLDPDPTADPLSGE